MKRIWIIILLFVIALLSLAFVQYNSIKTNYHYTKDIKEINYREERIHQSFKVLNLLLDVETGSRGYQLTGDDKFLAPYDAAEEKLPEEVKKLYNLLPYAQASNVERLVNVRVEHAVKLIQKKMRNETIHYSELDAGKIEMDNLRNSIRVIIETEESIISKKSKLANETSKNIIPFLVTGSVFSFLMTLLGGVVVYFEFKKRSKAEKHLQISLATSEAMANQIQFGIIAGDKSGNVLFINEWAKLKTLTNGADKKISNVKDFFKEISDKESIFNILFNDNLAKVQNLEVEFNNSNQVISVNSSPLVINNTYEGMILSLVDITETNKKMDSLSADKLSAISASQAKSDFLAKMSHEIRTPLNAILGVGDILSLTKLNNEQEKCLEIFQRSAQNLNNLVNDILDLSKIEAGKVEINENPFSLKSLVDSCTSIMDFRASQKGLLFSSNISSGCDHFLGDEGRIRQIVLNLLANAIKFTETGTITFNVSSTPHEENKFEINFSVRDTGKGISEENVGKLFSNYEQETSKISSEYGGTGLGLSLSRELARLMGGDIKLKSTLGLGSEFIFQAIFLKVDGEFIANRVADNEKLSPIKILLVDDNPENRFIVKKYLSETEVEIIEAFDGEDAVLKFKNTRVDVVLMDINMPRKDGLLATKEIREFEITNNVEKVCIIALSANALKQEYEKAKLAGCDDYLTKPISRLRLITMLKKWTGSMTKDQVQEDDDLDIDVDDDIKALIPSYLENRKKDLIALKDAMAKQDITVIAKIAHNIKGTALSYGQTSLDVSAKSLNEAAKELDWRKIEAIINQIEIILSNNNGN